KLKMTKHVLPSLKAKVETELKSMVVYQIKCSRCESSYVGQTARYLITRIKEHRNVNTPVGSHFQNCNCEILMENVMILDRTIKSEQCLMSLEALWINKVKPKLNTKDEYKSRTLTIKI
uniref:GIY-YIG domain-containing protein n=1 Tax=Clytia hemisphaerica TaxID=252671 RepID=A0A7M5X293_9CNID